jgi:hypothetical protein
MQIKFQKASNIDVLGIVGKPASYWIISERFGTFPKPLEPRTHTVNFPIQATVRMKFEKASNIIVFGIVGKPTSCLIISERFGTFPKPVEPRTHKVKYLVYL